MRSIEQTATPQSASNDVNSEWEGFTARLAQVLAHAGLSQTELARQLGISVGFVSEIARGVKRPGPDFFIGVRKLLGVSTDWLLCGEGSMTGGVGIRRELLLAIRLQIALVKASVNDHDPVATALISLIREGQLDLATADKGFSALLDRVAPHDEDLDFAVELYNSHLWTSDPMTQRRNLLAAVIAHFESRRPIDRLATVTGAAKGAESTSVQINIGQGQRVAGRNFREGGKLSKPKK